MASRYVPRTRLVVILIATLAVLAGCSGAMNGDSSAGAPQATDASGGVASDSRGGGGGVGSYYAQSGDRVVVREARMRLRVDNFSRSFRRLRAVAERNGGYLGDRSQDSQEEWDTGTITVRVPPENFASARDAIASLGHVENEDVSVLDFTGQYRDREERIRQLEREERALERLLNRTDDVDEADRVREDLREVRGHLRNLHGEQRSIRERERLSTIRVDMHEPRDRKPPKNYATAFGFTDAFLEAFYGGLTAVKYVIVFFGYAIPVGAALLPLGAFGVGLIASWRRVRRSVENSLASDAPASATATADTTGTDAGAAGSDDDADPGAADSDSDIGTDATTNAGSEDDAAGDDGDFDEEPGA